MRNAFAPIALCVVVVFGSVSLRGQSAEPWAGTWKLNMAKSKYSPGPAPKSQTVRLEAVGGGVKSVVDAVNDDNSKTHTEVVAKFDGKPYEVKGAAEPTTRTYKRVTRGYEWIATIGGKVTMTSRTVVSADGKTLTTTQTGRTVAGQAINNTLVWDRQ